MTKTNAIPPGYSTITPYLIVNNAVEAIEFYQKAFNAELIFKMGKPDGRIGHAEMLIRDSKFMLADEYPDMNMLGPLSLGGSPIFMHMYVDNVDVLGEQAVLAGAQILQPIRDQFYGDRSGTFVDPFGHIWCIATHIEDVSMEECRKRFEEMAKANKNC